MADTVSDLHWERLREWGVHRIFGYTGDGISAILGALARSDGDPQLVSASAVSRCA